MKLREIVVELGKRKENLVKRKEGERRKAIVVEVGSR